MTRLAYFDLLNGMERDAIWGSLHADKRDLATARERIEALESALADRVRDIIEGLRAVAADAVSEDAYEALSDFADSLEPLTPEDKDHE
jgi:hypothetical protein